MDLEKADHGDEKHAAEDAERIEEPLMETLKPDNVDMELSTGGLESALCKVACQTVSQALARIIHFSTD